MAETAPADDRGFPQAEPPSGSVVAIDWGGHYQEVWVSDRSNIGNWYTLDARLDFSRDHPSWYDVLCRAEGQTLTLLVPADADAYAAGFDAGVSRVGEAVSEAVDNMRLYVAGCHPQDGASDEHGGDGGG
jgi:hypothetical protein